MNLYQIYNTVSRLTNSVAQYSLVVAVLLLPTSSKACDACGCATSMSSLQVLPYFNSNLVGFISTHSSFSHPEFAVNNDGYAVISDQMQSGSFIYRSLIGGNVQLIYELPLHLKQRVYDGFIDATYGVGDFALSVVYTKTLFERERSAGLLRISPKIATPTGTFMERGRDRTILPSGMQLGTGSWSYGGMADLSLRMNSWGGQWLIMPERFSTNELSYKLGSRLTSMISARYFYQRESTLTVVQSGVRYERFGADTQYGVEKDFSGGERWSGTFGVSTYFKRMALQAQWAVPLRQNVPEAQPKLYQSASLGVLYFLEKRN